MQITGGCHCGAIRYKAQADPSRTRICHCSDCQRLSGTAFRVMVRVPEAEVTWVRGHPKIYVKTGENGAKREQAFCGECGSPLYASSVGGAPRALGLRVGSIDQSAAFIPSRQIWNRSRLAWLPGLAELVSTDTQ